MTPAAINLGIVVKTYTSMFSDKNYTKLTLSIMHLLYFTNLDHLFYKNNIKIVPINIIDILTPCGLAHWIMGDGSLHGQGLHLSVYAFTQLVHAPHPF
jgi:hypothetical protein